MSGGMGDMTIVLRSLRTRALATSVATALVAIAVALLLVLLSLREAASQAFRRGTGNIHLLISADASPLVAVLNGLFYANAPANPIPWAKFKEIEGGFPWQWCIPTQLGDSFRGSPVMATSEEFFTDFEPVAGMPFQFSDGRVFEDAFEVVAGSTAAKDHNLQVGQKIVFSHGSGGSREAGHEHADHPYEVVGVLQPTGSAHDRALFTNLVSTWVIHAEEKRAHETEAPATDAPTTKADSAAASPTDAGHDQHADHEHDQHHDHLHVDEADLRDDEKLITGILLRIPTRPGSDSSASIAAQFDRMRRDVSITVAQPAQQIGRLMALIGDVDWLFVAMAVVVLVSSAASIMLAMVSSMELRRRQVAILRVLGASAWRVFALAITESTLIGLLGAGIGFSLALIGGQIATTFLQDRVGLVIGGTVDPRSAILVAAGAVVLAALAGIVPAVKAYRTSIARHLRPLA
ncbi:MAG: FtsX-like permease family protein [Phycisphaerae bacterium]|nr:FtsX-like permease family protein [Phycisphaerae bacterium]